MLFHTCLSARFLELFPIRFFSERRFISLSEADANTSTGAPDSICVRRVPEPARFSSTVVPGWVASYSSAISVNASVRLAAAETVIVVGCSSVPGEAARKATMPRQITTARIGSISFFA